MRVPASGPPWGSRQDSESAQSADSRRSSSSASATASDGNGPPRSVTQSPSIARLTPATLAMKTAPSERKRERYLPRSTAVDDSVLSGGITANGSDAMTVPSSNTSATYDP